MLCYKDMTFCSFYESCKAGTGCFRAKTPQVIKDAIACDLGICQFTQTPDCFEKIEGIENDRV